MRRARRAATAGLSFVALTLSAVGCTSPLGGRDLELGATAGALPGLGGAVSFSQRMHGGAAGRLDAQVDLTHQSVDRDVGAHGRVGDTVDQIRAGVLWRPTPEASGTWTVRAGVAWLRAKGDPVFLDEPGDYGGGFFGLGYRWHVTPSLVQGPELTVQFFDSEGNGGSGFVPELAWGLWWKL